MLGYFRRVAKIDNCRTNNNNDNDNDQLEQHHQSARDEDDGIVTSPMSSLVVVRNNNNDNNNHYLTKNKNNTNNTNPRNININNSIRKNSDNGKKNNFNYSIKSLSSVHHPQQQQQRQHNNNSHNNKQLDLINYHHHHQNTSDKLQCDLDNKLFLNTSSSVPLSSSILKSTKTSKRRSIFRNSLKKLNNNNNNSNPMSTLAPNTTSQTRKKRINSKSSQTSSSEETTTTTIVDQSISMMVNNTTDQQPNQSVIESSASIHADNSRELRIKMKGPNNSNSNNNFTTQSSSINSNHQIQSSSPHHTPSTATFCPTIASALWRPLWPPGWNPRSNSTNSTGIGDKSSNNPCFDNSAVQILPDNNSTIQKNRLKSTTNKNNHLGGGGVNRDNNKMPKSGNNTESLNHHCDKMKHIKQQHGKQNGDDSAKHLINTGNYNEDFQKVEDWLDEHPDFVQSYVVRKVPRSAIDKWLLAHSPSIASGAPFFNNNINNHHHQQQQSQQQQNSSGQDVAPATNSGANTPVRKISAHEFETITGGGYLRPMVSTTCDGTLTFLQETENKMDLYGDNNNSGMTSGESMFSFQQQNDSSTKSLNRQRSNQLSQSSQSMLKHQNSINDSDYSDGHPSSLSPCIRSRMPSIISIRTREELKAIKDEKELIFELVKDICNDLDAKSLCHKILTNVSMLTDADRCSLFLVKGEKVDSGSRCLVSQLFDVCGQSTIEQVSQKEEIIIPWGTGIVGHVAESGIAVNIPDCYQDPRFTNTIDQKTGYKTRNMLCNPIFDFNGEVMGVAQVINKKNAPYFDKNDENVFAKYLQFCGIGLRNAQLYERSQLENRRNQVLLDLARMVFEKQSNIESIIYRILIHILSLLQCERCQIMLLADDENDDDFNLYSFGPTASCYSNMNDCESSRLFKRINRNRETSSESSSSNVSTTSDFSYDLAAKGSFSNANNNDASVRTFYRVFDLEAADLKQHDFEQNQNRPFEGRFPINIGITGYVAATGETLNIPDAYSDSRFDPIVDEQTTATNGFRHKSILCMPIRNATRKIIGVAQLVNKLNGRPFNKNDENLFEAFAIFSGMGIENTQIFEKAVKAMAKQKVTLELLSYHASANEQEASKFARMLIPSTSSLSLSCLRFDDFGLNEDQMIKACIRMFIDLDLIERFHIDYKVLCKWILSVRKNYRPVLYHNWRHAFNVAQMMFAIFVNTDMCLVLGELETLALIVACLCHDLDHRGTNNSFQIKTSSPLAQLYSTSTLEHHHFDQSLMILNSQGNQILANLSPEEYRRVVHVLEEAILATDLAMYIKKRDQFFEIIDKKTYNWTNGQHRSLLRSMLMTCCDVAAITKPWEVQKLVAELVASEFYQQGDIEKEQLNIEPIDMMNREKKEELPKMQLSFIDSICLPIYKAFAKLCPDQLDILLKGVEENREAWNLLSNEPYQLSIRGQIDTGDNEISVSVPETDI